MKTNAKPAQKPSVKKAGFRHRKRILVIVILLVIAAAAAVFLFRLRSRNADVSRITTYNVEEITYGNVSTTVSGSGTLTPVTSETLTASAAGEVQSVNFSVGDEVAPGGSVAMAMGKDGFSMGIAVDELNISSIALDQEVAFTIDAVDGDYTGSVTEISYNGSSSNGSTAFQITAEVEYIEGVYPGMSASAEIVIEDSGDGLIVPVDAVGTSGDENYVYLAPSGSEPGDSYEEDAINTEDLTRVTVETTSMWRTRLREKYMSMTAD